LINAEKLGFQTDDTGAELLADVSLRIRPGERVGIVGPSGAGKTTLALHLAGLHGVGLAGRTTGTLRLKDQDCTPSGCQGFAGVVLQNPEIQLFCETVEEEIALGLKHRVGTFDAAAEMQRLLGLFDLGKVRDHPVATLSLGWKQRLSLVSMLALGPDILLLDEPTSYLDESAANELFTVLAAQAALGLTILVVEHEVPRLLPWATRILAMRQGRIVFDGRPETYPLPPDSFVLNEEDSPALLKTSLAPQLGGESRVRGLHTSCCHPHPTLSRTRERENNSLFSTEQGRPPRSHENVPVRLSLEHVTFAYAGSTPVVHDLSLRVTAGEVVAIVGPNGSGKSTLLSLIKGLLEPEEGRIAGPSPGPRMDTIGLVFQNPDSQLFAHSVYEECAFLPRNLGLSDSEIGRRTAGALARVGIGRHAERVPFSLSYGEKRRLTLASVLSGQPAVLCLDEPTVGLDWECVRDLAATLRQFGAEGGAVLLATHDLAIARLAATRIVTLDGGRVTGDTLTHRWEA
jgi:energy-coupling factor transport system ATP-binding protein